MAGTIYLADNLEVLQTMQAGSAQLVYIDPPFNRGCQQRYREISVTENANGEQGGFGGKRYAVEVVGEKAYPDSFADYAAFLRPRLVEARRILSPQGSLYFHIDFLEVHRCRFLLDEIFGEENFLSQ